jgi:hypothetical protein
MPEEYKTGPVPSLFFILGLVVNTALIILGLLYALHGNPVLSVFLAFVLLIIQYLLVRRLVYFKTKKVKMQRQQNQTDRLPEFLLNAIFLLTVVVSFPVIFHFIDVDFYRKDSIRKTGLAKLADIRNLRNSYDTAVLLNINGFRGAVETEMTNYFGAYGSQKIVYMRRLEAIYPHAIDFRRPNTIIESQIRDLIRQDSITRKSKLTLEDKYPVYDAYIDKATGVFDNWDRLNVGYFYSDADTMYQRLFTLAKAKMSTFTSGHTASPVNMDNVFESLGNASLLEILAVLLVIIILNLCILAPYIAAPRYFKAISRNTKAYESPEGSIKINV